MTVVDVHAHFIPTELLDAARAGAAPPGLRVVDRPGRPVLIEHDNGLAYPVFDVFHDVGAKLAAMDADGIDVSLISISPTLFLYWLEPGEALAAARLFNDAAARMARESGGRLRPLATVPLNDPPAAATELRRARRELDCVGVEIGPSIGDVQLDDRTLDPFWSEAERLGLPVMLHPYLSMISPPPAGLTGYHLANAVGNPFETAVGAARLLVGGVLERHPGLRVLLVHGGGALPFQLHRLEHAYGAREEVRASASRPPSAYLHQLLFDTILFDAAALAFLVDQVGDEHVLYGTDVPFDMADTSTASLLAGASATRRARIMGENAIAAFSLAVGDRDDGR